MIKNTKATSKSTNTNNNTAKNSSNTSNRTIKDNSTTNNKAVTTPSTKQEVTESSDNKTEMVWVGETGTKYHYEDCRTLKGKGHQITLEQALAEGREPCKVCH